MVTDPFGRSPRRSIRLSDEETARRMLAAGVRMVDQSGLQLSFDVVRLEDIIDAADVSRSAVYRRWPSKGHYFADLLLELAGATHPVAAAYSEKTVEVVCDLASEHLASLRTPAGRRALLIELCRQGAQTNFETIINGRYWHTYIALHATLCGLPEGSELERTMRQTLRRSEDVFRTRMSHFYELMSNVIGYRPKNIPGMTFKVIASLGASVVEGLAIDNAAVPENGTARFTADPFNVGVAQEWSMSAIGFTSIFLTLIEPIEPDSDWGDERLAAAREALAQVRATAGVQEANA